MFSVLSVSAFCFFAAAGLLLFILTLIVPMRAPADTSNRIAHLILVWEALKSPHRFVGLRDEQGDEVFAYLKQDLGDFLRNRKQKPPL